MRSPPVLSGPWLQLFGLPGFPRATVWERFWRYQHARSKRLLALHYNLFTGLQAGLDYPHGANAFSDLNRTDCHPVVRAR